MDKSFRTILAERMNNGSAAPTADSVAPRARLEERWIGALEWSAPFTVRPASAYAREARLSREAALRAVQPKPEPVLPLETLSAADLADLRRLVELGGTDLEDGLSSRRLRSAYRRLALRYHPDAGHGAGHETFLDVRARYGRLSRRLQPR